MIVIVVVVAVLTPLCYGYLALRLPASLDATRIESAVTALPPAAIEAHGDIDKLRSALADAAATLDDGEGKLLFVDSEIPDDVPTLGANERILHYEVVELLRAEDLVFPAHAPRFGEMPQPSDDVARARAVATAYRRIANRALVHDRSEIAAKYIIGALFLHGALRANTGLEELAAELKERMHLVGMAVDAARKSGDDTLVKRMMEAMALVDTRSASTRTAVDRTIHAHWSLVQTPPDDAGLWNGALMRKELMTKIGWLLVYRDLCEAPPMNAPALEKNLAEITPHVPEWLECDRAMNVYRQLTTARDLIKKRRQELTKLSESKVDSG